MKPKKRKIETESECVCSTQFKVEKYTADENLLDGEKQVIEHHAGTYTVAGSKKPEKSWTFFINLYKVKEINN